MLNKNGYVVASSDSLTPHELAALKSLASRGLRAPHYMRRLLQGDVLNAAVDACDGSTVWIAVAQRRSYVMLVFDRLLDDTYAESSTAAIRELVAATLAKLNKRSSVPSGAGGSGTSSGSSTLPVLELGITPGVRGPKR